MPDADNDLRYLLRKVLLHLSLLHPEAYADPDVTETLVACKKLADRMALAGRLSIDGRRGLEQPMQWKEAA